MAEEQFSELYKEEELEILENHITEMGYKYEHDTETLLDAMQQVSHIVDIHRPSVVADKHKLQ